MNPVVHWATSLLGPAVGDALPLGVLFEQAASSSVIPARATSVRLMLPPRSMFGH